MLTDKLRIPELPEGTVTRLRLIERIEQGASGAITYLCAPAGFGKTVLLADWARRVRTKPAWLTVGPEHNEPMSFWQAVIRAADEVVPGFAQRVGNIMGLSSDTAVQSGIAGLPSIVRKCIRPDKFVEKTTNLAILKYMSQTLGEVGCSMRQAFRRRHGRPLRKRRRKD